MKRYTVEIDIEPNDVPRYSDEDIPLDHEDWYGEGFPRETWYNDDGKIDRQYGPARTVYHEDDPNIIIKQEWIRDGLRYREDGPAVLLSFTDGKVIKEKYYKNGVLHRDDAPAVEERCPATGIVVHEAWYQHGKLHRVGGPADIHRQSDTGVLNYELWAIEGQKHRLDGPAYTERRESTGEIAATEYYRYGVEVKKDQNLPAPAM